MCIFYIRDIYTYNYVIRTNLSTQFFMPERRENKMHFEIIRDGNRAYGRSSVSLISGLIRFCRTNRLKTRPVSYHRRRTARSRSAINLIFQKERYHPPSKVIASISLSARNPRNMGLDPLSEMFFGKRFSPPTFPQSQAARDFF